MARMLDENDDEGRNNFVNPSDSVIWKAPLVNCLNCNIGMVWSKKKNVAGAGCSGCYEIQMAWCCFIVDVCFDQCGLRMKDSS